MTFACSTIVSAAGWLVGLASLAGCGVATPRLSDSRLLMHPPPPWTGPASVRVVTYNIGDLPLADRRDAWRMAAVADLLAQLDPDIVCLQEAFEERNREIVLRRLEGTPLRHHHAFESGVVGSGLLVISRWPIEETMFWRFSENGSPTRGDWWAGKGVALARVRLPQGVLDVFSTHLLSYFLEPRTDRSIRDEDAAARRDDGGFVAANLDSALRRDVGVRCVQVLELSAFVLDASSPTCPAVVLGDFNCWDGAPELRIALDGGGLRRPDRADAAGAPRAREERDPGELFLDFDHVFVAEKPDYAYSELKSEWIATLSVEGHPMRPSDHHAVVADLRIVPTAAAPARESTRESPAATSDPARP